MLTNLTTNILATTTLQVWQYVIGSILFVISVCLTLLVLMQSSKDKSLSGSIAGGAETFFGKSKASTMDKVLSKLTIVGSVLFVVLAIVLTILLTK